MKSLVHFLICGILLFAGHVAAQNLVGGEYFIGPDPGVGNATAFNLPANSGDSLTMNVPINHLNLSPGEHTIRVRLRANSGLWSEYIPVVVWVQEDTSELAGAEYFLGTDPGVGNGTAFSLPALSLDSLGMNVPINHLNLPTGQHTIRVRLRANSSLWSEYIPVVVWVQEDSSALVGAEYFFGTDPGVGNATPLSLPANSEDSFTTSFPLPSTGLPKGRTEAKIRLKSSNGTWSTYHTESMEIFEDFALRKLAGIEYTYDHDSGFANPYFIPLNNLDLLDSALIFATSGLALGDYNLLIRAVAQSGARSPIIRKNVSICTTYGPRAGFELITNDEYQVNFIDTTEGGSTYFWHFGDNTNDSARSPVHDYPGPGVYNVCLVATNACGSDSTCNELVLRGIKDFTPKKANQGFATIRVNGFGFTANDDVRLVSSSDSLSADSVIFLSETRLLAMFDLNLLLTGNYDLKVQQGTQVFETTKTFEVLPTIQDYDFELLRGGFSSIAVGRNIRNNLTVVNKTNTDAFAVPLILKYEFNLPTLSGFTQLQHLHPINVDTIFSDYANWVNTNSGPGWMMQSHVVDSIGNMYAAYLIPYIPAGGSVAIPEAFVASTPWVTINVLGTVSPSPWLMPDNFSEQASITNHNPLRSREFKRAVEKLLDSSYTQSHWNANFDPVYQRHLKKTKRLSLNAMSQSSQTFIPLHAINGQILIDLLAEMGVMGQVSFQEIQTILIDMHKIADRLNYYADPALPLPETGVMDGFRFCTGCVTYNEHNTVVATDPNEKETSGTGSQHHINGGSYINYNILFENVDTASAHAGYVEIRDTLDTSLLDASTLEILGFSVDTNFYAATPGYREYDWLVDMRPEHPIYLRVRARYIDSLSLVKWTFESLDTIWYELPADPLAGFLPPNVNKPEGEGMISFRVALKPGLPQGTTISNQAEIVFDVNAPIATSEVSNLYDSIPPTSQFVNLPTVFYEKNPLLQFTGTDNISQIMWYQLMAMDTTDGNTFFKPYLEDRSNDTARFAGEFGKTYWMYTLATDSALNVEDKALPAAIDSVRFEDPCPLPFSITPTITHPSCAGEASGMLSLSVNNAFAPFEYEWSTGDSTASVDSLAAGTYQITVYNKYGCADSVSVSLTDPPAVQHDSISLSICSGDSVQIGGNWIDQAGIYTDSLITAQQCDSLVFYTVDVEPSPQKPSISRSNDTLFANVIAPAYQWYENGSAIIGQTQDYLALTNNGNYQVEAIDADCKEISDIFAVSNISLDDQAFPAIWLYPNPVSKGDWLSIENKGGDSFSINIVDLAGKTILETEVEQEVKRINTQHFAKGIYCVKIVYPTSQGQVFRFVVF